MREDKSKDDLARSVQIWYELLTLKSRQFLKVLNGNLGTLEIFKSSLDMVWLLDLGDPAWTGMLNKVTSRDPFQHQKFCVILIIGSLIRFSLALFNEAFV